MKKLIALFLALVCSLVMVGCGKATYKVEIADNYPIANTLKPTYAAGEEVTVKLATITEHYYVLSVNGVEQEMDRDASDLTYTYFTFTMPSEDVLIKIEDHWVDIPLPPQSPSEKPMPIALTIVETIPSGIAFEYREPNTPYCFYAFDEDENLYRVLWTDWDGLREKDRVIVEYEKLEELTYDEYPDGGWIPQYELTATSVNTTSCISNEQGTFVLTLPKSGKRITLRDDQNVFVPYIADALVVAAENKITDDIAEYNNSSGFYLQVDGDDLCLYQEVIRHLDEPKENVGCFDHEHLFFSQRITLYPVNTQSSVIADEGTDNETSEHSASIELIQYRWDGWGVSTKTVKDHEIAYLIIDSLKSLKKTGEIVPQISDDALDENGYDYPVKCGTMWIECENKLYRLTPDLSEICLVETHFGEGKVLEMTDDLKTDVNNAWYYAPYDYYKGTYNNGDSTVALKNVFKSDSSIQLIIKEIKIDNSFDPDNTIHIELISTADQEVTVKLYCQQSGDNLANGDSKTVELKKNVPTTVELTFGGWPNYSYWVYIEADNTKAEIAINPC